MELIAAIDNLLWGYLLVFLLLGVGILLTFVLRGIQFRMLGPALYLALIRRKEEGADGDISHFQALMTALAATVGTGNIVGVATAIAAGGPGALFWMWITALFGMATKYSEALLGVKYRHTDAAGRRAADRPSISPGASPRCGTTGPGEPWGGCSVFSSRFSLRWLPSASATWCRPTPPPPT